MRFSIIIKKYCSNNVQKVCFTIATLQIYVKFLEIMQRNIFSMLFYCKTFLSHPRPIENPCALPYRDSRGQAEKEFKVEVEAIGKVRHKNLVGLVGYCAEGARRYYSVYMAVILLNI